MSAPIGPLPPPSVPTRESVEAKSAGNDQRIHRLSQAGARIDMASVQSVRLGLLCEYLLGDMDDPNRLRFENMLADRYREIIEDAEKQVRMAQLTPTAAQTSKLIVPR